MKKMLILFILTGVTLGSVPQAAMPNSVENNNCLRPAASVNVEVRDPEDNLDEVINRVFADRDNIRAKGGFATDIDDTLVATTGGAQQTLNDYPELLEAFCDLLCSGFKIWIITQPSYEKQGEKVKDPIIEALKKRNRLDAIENFVMYTAGGAYKVTFKVSGGQVEESFDDSYNKPNEIEMADLEIIRQVLANLLFRREASDIIVKATAKRLKRLPAKEQDKIKVALGLAGLNYGALYEKFEEFQKQRMQPRIEVREKVREIRNNVMIAARTAVFENKDYPIFRETMINIIKKALGKKARQYSIKPGGTSTIDITKKGVDKTKAMRDIIGGGRQAEFIIFTGNNFKTRESSDGVVLDVLGAGNCLTVCKSGEEGEATRIGDDYRATHIFYKRLTMPIEEVWLIEEAWLALRRQDNKKLDSLISLLKEQGMHVFDINRGEWLRRQEALEKRIEQEEDGDDLLIRFQYKRRDTLTPLLNEITDKAAELAKDIGFNDKEITKIKWAVYALSENIFKFADEGLVILRRITKGGVAIGMEVIGIDKGRGITEEHITLSQATEEARWTPWGRTKYGIEAMRQLAGFYLKAAVDGNMITLREYISRETISFKITNSMQTAA